MRTDTTPATGGRGDTPDGTATRTAIVINAEDVHRDWRHLSAETVGVTLGVTASGALALAVFQQAPALMWVLGAGSAALAVALLALIVLMQREGRRWTYATDID